MNSIERILKSILENDNSLLPDKVPTNSIEKILYYIALNGIGSGSGASISLVDDLTTQDTTKGLTANQGYILDQKRTKEITIDNTTNVVTIKAYNGDEITLNLTDFINEILKDYNLKTYTELSQIGITTTPTTVQEIFNALSDNSYLNISCSTGVVSDVPSENGILIINKRSSARFNIEYKISLSGSVGNNIKFIGTLKGSDGSGLTWSRVCTTSVDDLPKTSSGISFVNNDTAKGSIIYSVKNGYANVSIMGVNFTSGTSCEISGLPKPSQYIYNNLGCSGSVVGEIYAYPNSSTIKVVIPTTGSTGYGFISYPVSES